MVEILGNEYKLNSVVCIGYLNERNCYEVISGRIYAWSDRSVSLDTSYDFQQLNSTVRIRLDRVKYVKETIKPMWRG
jgi:hypothetical protein